MAKSTQTKSSKNPSNPSEIPQVYKKTELEVMLELIENGVYSTKNLATALHVDESTVTAWKKRPEVKEAHTKAILKYSGKRTDIDGILKELDLQTAQREEQSTVRVIIEDYGSTDNPATQTTGSDKSE